MPRKKSSSSDEVNAEMLAQEPVEGESVPSDDGVVPLEDMVQREESGESHHADMPTGEGLPEDAFPLEEESPFSDADSLKPHSDDVGPTADNSEYNDLLQEWSEGEHLDISEEEKPLTLETASDVEQPVESQQSDTPSAAMRDHYDSPDNEGHIRHSAGAGEATPNPRRERVLTINARDEVQTEEDQKAVIWHEIQNAHWTHRILTGKLDGVERTESGLTLAVVDYKGFRIAIPVKEMMLFPGRIPSGPEFQELMSRARGILTARLGSEIDFIIRGHENESRAVIASRRDAMLRKRQIFYLNTDEMGRHMIYEGRVVEARVVAATEKLIRVEVFGVECTIAARDLDWSWIGNVATKYEVGQKILVRVREINGNTPESLSITADARSVSKDTSLDTLKKCVVQGRYVGRITDVRGGVVFIRLNNGANAIAHSCYDRRTPGKQDDVSFAVTRLDMEQGIAVGIITRIIKQNL